MGNTALVTGANRGIGLAVARRLAELGHFVFLASRDRQAGHEAAAALRRSGLQARPLRLDLADTASIDAAVAEAASSGHTIEILINNAGALCEKPLSIVFPPPHDFLGH